MRASTEQTGKTPRRKVAIVAYDGVRAFEFGVAVEVFALLRPGFEDFWYQSSVVAAEPLPLRGLGGLEVHPTAPLSSLKHFSALDTIVLPGWRTLEEPAPPRLLTLLRQASARGVRMLSICSGAFLLAQAGLLVGKRATTHWMYADAFQQKYPAVAFEPDVLYVEAGTILTSAGSAAGIDACLHLVRRDFGGKVANTVARRMVVAPHREGGQAQFVEAPVPMRAGNGIARVMDWARKRLDQPLRVEALARQCAMSERTFLRRFQAEAAITPQLWLAKERMQRASELLESTRLGHDEIALRCGYQTTQAFRAAFRKLRGVAPSVYREHFHRAIAR